MTAALTLKQVVDVKANVWEAREILTGLSNPTPRDTYAVTQPSSFWHSTKVQHTGKALNIGGYSDIPSAYIAGVRHLNEMQQAFAGSPNTKPIADALAGVLKTMSPKDPIESAKRALPIVHSLTAPIQTLSDEYQLNAAINGQKFRHTLDPYRVARDKTLQALVTEDATQLAVALPSPLPKYEKMDAVRAQYLTHEVPQAGVDYLNAAVAGA